MRRLTFLLPLLVGFVLVFGQSSSAQSPTEPSDVYAIADLSSERLVVFEAFLRPG
jgi:hypothetical protein